MHHAGLLKEALELHYGKCRIEFFFEFGTKNLNISASAVDLICFF